MAQDQPADQAQRAQAGSLRDRLRFAGLDQEQCDAVRRHRPALQAHLKAGLRDLFQRYQSHPDASRNFSSERQIERARTIQGQKSGDGAFALVCRQAGPNFAEQPLHIDRLGIEIGTSDLDALVAIAGQRVGRQRNDWNC